MGSLNGFIAASNSQALGNFFIWKIDSSAAKVWTLYMKNGFGSINSGFDAVALVSYYSRILHSHVFSIVAGGFVFGRY